MTLQQMEYVVAVADLGNFRMAAEKCFITQSTLSTMIAKLEDELEITIFNRTTKPVSITSEGQVLIRQCRIILREVEQCEEIVSQLKGEFRGLLRIGVIPTIAPFLLPKFINSFVKLFPHIQFNIFELTTRTILERLNKRELDLGIAALPLNDPNLIEHKLYNEEFALFDCQNEQAKEKINMKSLCFDQLWILEEGHCLSNQMLKICEVAKRTQHQSNLQFKAGSIDSLVRFVKENKGTTLLPYLSTIDFSESDKQKLSYFTTPVPVRSVGILHHKHFVKLKLLEQLKEQIQKSIIPLLQANAKELVIEPE